MNDFETIYNNNPLDERVAINTANLVTYIKNNIDIDILEDKNVTKIKRYITKDTIEFTFHYKDKMYMATYFIKENDYEINKLV
ncbi:MAG: hypothetical protein E6937_01985 [Staphylococcus epidermidis]|nr:hypothetical protein [Staphylococcus epidermidis]